MDSFKFIYSFAATAECENVAEIQIHTFFLLLFLTALLTDNWSFNLLAAVLLTVLCIKTQFSGNGLGLI